MVLGARRSGSVSFARLMAQPFVLLRVPPNALTLAGLVFAFLPAALFYYREWLWGGVALLLVSGFDLVDGAVARARGLESKFGGYLDSVLDRAADGVFLVGIGLGLDDRAAWVPVGLGLVGQGLVSYTRARSYQDGAPPPEAWSQFFERPERILFLVGATLLAGALELWGPWAGADALFWALWLYAILCIATATQRVLKVRKFHRQTQI